MEKVLIRLFYSPPCSCCKCGPDNNLMVFQGMAEELAEKFGDKITFEAYNAVNAKKFPFLEGQKAPVIAVGEKIVSSGKMPLISTIEDAVNKSIK